MVIADVLTDAFERVHGIVHRAVEGLTPEQLGTRVNGRSNSITWLIWHLTRIQDDHLADAASTEQIWTSGGWAGQFALPFETGATGYGQTFDEVGQVQVSSGKLLTDYYDAVHHQTLGFVKTLDGAALDRIVDDTYDPPVTLGARLISVMSDDLQHAGQAALVRGLLAN